jgi:hypothetical protein
VQDASLSNPSSSAIRLQLPVEQEDFTIGTLFDLQDQAVAICLRAACQTVYFIHSNSSDQLTTSNGEFLSPRWQYRRPVFQAVQQLLAALLARNDCSYRFNFAQRCSAKQAQPPGPLLQQ